MSIFITYYIAYLIISMVGLCLLKLIPMMIMYNKKGEHSWGALIPIYSQIIQLRISGLSPWLVLLYFIPVANVVITIINDVRFIKAYNRDTAFAVVALFFPVICYPVVSCSISDQEENANTDKKVSKTLYAVLTLLLGTFGINKFYAGKIKSGLLSILFCWTGIPTILSVAEFITIVSSIKADKDGQIAVTSERRSNVLFGVSLVLFVLFVLATIIPWESLFTKFTAFSDFNTTLSKIKIGNYAVFSNIIGAPVSVDATTGSSSGVINAIGSWTMTDVAILLFVLAGVIALCSKIKFNDFVETVTGGIKKVLPVAITAMLISIVLVIMVTSGVNVTITNWIVSWAKGFNIATISLATMVGSVLTSDFHYFVSTIAPVFTSAVTNSDLYGALGLIIQSVFNLMMIIAPTSVGLIIGLYYLDIPFGKWFKYIWKVLLALFVIVIVAAIIVFALV